ncbi:beta-N-acetylhexosaminidase [Planobispora rosea]|uniref:beta-N-acetylhexosaminidase n=1 Tax=Planobispora rosea TaxID=35762 RepID=A0A8J3S8X1_PLARO|nr:family 20 glycosylhydrolase [Planobispora rosea]GGS93150.1 beta-N-acetylhexosaminidase [Planobispora rosea]GIH87174.1 beta-N-acetylhexosaminidase [Planobispora rosea]
MSEPSAPVVPLPQSLTPEGGDGLRLGARVRVGVSSDDLLGLGHTVAGLLRVMHGADSEVRAGGGACLRADLLLVLVPEVPGAAGLAPARGLDPLARECQPTGPGGAAGAAGSRECYELVVTSGGATVTASSAEGLFRGSTTFAQLLTRRGAGDGLAAPAVRVLDGPALRWRGLSLDVVRRFFPVEQVKKVVDLLALYKFNVLHLHLTDSQAWRLEITGRPGLTDPANWPADEGSRNGDGPQFYTRDDYREIVAYAAERFVTVVPEIDMPGHALAAVRAHPELGGPDEPPHPLLPFLDPRAEATDGFVADVVSELAALTPGPFLHIGGDEAFGMPHELYAAFTARALHLARTAGKRVVTWQEAARSGALTPADLVQCWIGDGDAFDAEAARKAAPAEYHPLIDTVARSFEQAPQDAPAAVAAGASVLASPSSVLYLDRRYAEDSLLPDQTARRERVGFPSYEPRTSRELFGWQPETLAEIPQDARLAGVEAAIWCETVTGFDDLAFLLLPRLPGIAEKGWTPRPTGWAGYRDRVAAHAGWWERLGWGGYYRSAEVFGAVAADAVPE